MTSYGTIPTSSHPTPKPNLEFISRAKGRIKSEFAARRSWSLMLDLRSFTLPHGLSETVSRIKTNLSFFRMNYVIVVLIVLFLSLLWHPISLIVFVLMMLLWLFLYFLRDEPLVIFSRTIDDRTVMIVLSVLTIALLLLTHATVNIVVSVLVGLAVVVVHAAVRRTEDLPLGEEAARLFAESSS